MKTKVITEIQSKMNPYLNQNQIAKLTEILLKSLENVEITEKVANFDIIDFQRNEKLLKMFLASKKVEGCSEKTINYYESTIIKLLNKIKKNIEAINTDDIRIYLSNFKEEKNLSKVTLDNNRRIFSSFFAWLEDEDYIHKNPVRRIHKIKTGRIVKETLTDENLEILRDNTNHMRDLAIIELLISTGIRVGELVNIDIKDINFHERECIVFGKGESEREAYFDARCKIHLTKYINSRNDNNPALFVSINKPHKRLGIGGIEIILRKLGKKLKISKVHPHKFRRTLATNAIDKGMPIEQVQKLLGHIQIDTTMQYAMVNQNNVKIAHRKYIG
jgi:site-specific recombinase XerD